MKPILAFALSLSLAAGAAAAQPSPALPDRELAEMRGAYIVVDGVTLDFGAVVRSYAGGDMVLETRYSLGDNGLMAERAGGDGAGLGGAAALARGQIDLAGLAAKGGVYTSADGQTAFAHRLEDGQLANMLFNTADGRDLRQETDITLTLPGFDAVQSGISDALTARRMADDIATASQLN